MLKKTILTTVMAMLALIAVSHIVLAGGVGTIRIDPYLSDGISSPAEFEVWVKPSSDPTSDPHIFLVMTNSSFNGLTDEVTVEWTDDDSPDLTITKDEWAMDSENGKKIPPGTVAGAGYTVASLKDHLDTSEPIYWVFKPFLDESVTATPANFTVTLSSTNPKMLVYVIGKTGECELFNTRVPPTIPGFVIPEPATIAALTGSLIVLATYAIAKRKN